MITAYHAKYYAHELTRRSAASGVDRLSQSLFDASVDLNPHQIEAALFALRNPLQEGVLLADEVGLGKTIEAALVICQHWAERRRRLLVICPASLRKQWAQELHDKFAVPASVIDAVSLRKQSAGDILATLQTLAGKGVVILSFQFAARLEAELRAIPWDVVVIDEAHKLRNAHRASNRTGQALKRALEGRKKLLLTATPLQNSLMELYGLSTLIDEHLFGDESAFRKRFMNNGDATDELRARLNDFGLAEMAFLVAQAAARQTFLDQLEELARDSATTEAAMHKSLELSLWVFGPEYSLFSSNITLKRQIEDVLNTTYKGKNADKRPDLLLNQNLSGEYLLIEFKRPDHSLNYDDYKQAIEYRHDFAKHITSPIRVVLIGGRLSPDFPKENREPNVDARIFSQVIASARRQVEWLLRIDHSQVTS